MIYVGKKYTISETTRVQREKIANDALAISVLDAPQPSERTMSLVDEYIKGNMEIEDILKETINYYQVSL